MSVFGSSSSQFEYYNVNKPWKVNGISTSVSYEFTHLGVNYNLVKPSSTAIDTTEARLKGGRNTTYALMGAGLHGINSVNPVESKHNVFVMPRITYR